MVSECEAHKIVADRHAGNLLNCLSSRQSQPEMTAATTGSEVHLAEVHLAETMAVATTVSCCQHQLLTTVLSIARSPTCIYENCVKVTPLSKLQHPTTAIHMLATLSSLMSKRLACITVHSFLPWLLGPFRLISNTVCHAVCLLPLYTTVTLDTQAIIPTILNNVFSPQTCVWYYCN